MSSASRHVLINGLSIGSGGGYTVAREVLRHLALARTDWRITLVVTKDNPLHEPMGLESLPPNADLLWAPPNTAKRLARWRYERGGLARWAAANAVDADVQLNGMVVPGLNVPTLAHFQDPWPYRPEAWSKPQHRLLAALKRRSHRATLRRADCCGFTSRYLEELITGYHQIKPRRSAVFYNGLPESWIERAQRALPDWSARPMTIVSVSNVDPYKRQSLVIEALPRVRRRPGLENTTYRILGQVSDDYRAQLAALARRLGVADAVTIEGRVSDARVAEALGQAKVFALMSVCESFGVPAIEAMSFGTPVVTSDCCAMPEVCGDAADLSPVDDVAALADRLARVMTDPAHADELRRRGAQQTARFHWRETARQMADSLGAIF